MTRSYRALLFTLAVGGFAADQASKYGVFNWLYRDGQPVGSREVVPGAFRLFVQFDDRAPAPDTALVRWNGPVPPHVNHGALFSFTAWFDDPRHRNTFFACISVVAALGITVWSSRRAAATDRWLCTALGLILGGTLGNLFDRVVFGGVRDFLYFYLIEWPVFNVADCCLVVGAGMLLAQALFGKAKEPTPVPASGAA